VVVPAHNAAETLADTLDSLLAQTHREWEAIVVDDGSTDRTAEVGKEYADRDPRISLIRQRQAGEAGARNRGFTEVKRDWVLFLDAGDSLAPAHLERMTAALVTGGALEAVICGSARVAVDGTMTPRGEQPPSGDLFPLLARRPAFPVHACLVRRSVVDAAGRFDPALEHASDWDLWQRIARTGAGFGAVGDVLAFERVRPGSGSTDGPSMARDGLRVLRQGHAPDHRVSNPHERHAGGAPPDGVRAQQYYLIAWCAGLMIGRGADARPLLGLVRDQYPGLSAERVADALFDAGPLATGQSPAGWEALWPRAQGVARDFLRALESQTTSAELAARAITRLEHLILEQSAGGTVLLRLESQLGQAPTAAAPPASVAALAAKVDKLLARFAALDDDRSGLQRHLEALTERVLAGVEQSTERVRAMLEGLMIAAGRREPLADEGASRLGDLIERTVARLEGFEQRPRGDGDPLAAKCTDLSHVVDRQRMLIEEREAQIADLEARFVSAVEDERSALMSRIDALEQEAARARTEAEALATKLVDLERQVVPALEADRIRLQERVADLLATVGRQRAAIDEHEARVRRLERERQLFQRLAEERGEALDGERALVGDQVRRLAHLEATRWVRAGRRLGLLPTNGARSRRLAAASDALQVGPDGEDTQRTVA
jgi:hypothetical protein